MPDRSERGPRSSPTPLGAALGRLRRRTPLEKPAVQKNGLDLSPATAFEALLRERVDGLDRALGELRGRLNGLIFLVVGAVIAQVVLDIIR